MDGWMDLSCCLEHEVYDNYFDADEAAGEGRGLVMEELESYRIVFHAASKATRLN